MQTVELIKWMVPRLIVTLVIHHHEGQNNSCGVYSLYGTTPRVFLKEICVCSGRSVGCFICVIMSTYAFVRSCWPSGKRPPLFEGLLVWKMTENCQHEQIAAPVLQMGPFAVLSDAAPPLMMTKNPLKGSRFVQAANYNVVFMYLYYKLQCRKTSKVTQFKFSWFYFIYIKETYHAQLHFLIHFSIIRKVETSLEIMLKQFHSVVLHSTTTFFEMVSSERKKIHHFESQTYHFLWRASSLQEMAISAAK